MRPVDSSAPRALSQSPVDSPAQSKPQAAAQQRPAVPGNRDEFVASRASTPAAPSPAAPADLNASVDKITNKGARSQMTTGRITINGHTYTYRSGGNGNGNLPNGDYKVTPHMWSRNTPGMVVDGVGFSFALSDKYDPRVKSNRTALRIHPDGGSPGTHGCIGIVGNGATQKQFREDMRAELNRHGGSFTLHVG
jgi:hypothetical protein